MRESEMVRLRKMPTYKSEAFRSPKPERRLKPDRAALPPPLSCARVDMDGCDCCGVTMTASAVYFTGSKKASAVEASAAIKVTLPIARLSRDSTESNSKSEISPRRISVHDGPATVSRGSVSLVCMLRMRRQDQRSTFMAAAPRPNPVSICDQSVRFRTRLDLLIAVGITSVSPGNI